MKLTDVFKILGVCLLISCSNKKISIIPISPIYRTDLQNKVLHHNYYYAVKNVRDSKIVSRQLDSFVRKNYPSKYLMENQAVSFLFYKYKKGGLDENFDHDDNTKASNINFKQDDLICSYYWLHGRFMYVTYYNNRSTKLEKRSW